MSICKIISLLSFIIILFCNLSCNKIFPPSSGTPGTISSKASPLAQDILYYVNEHRKSLGKNELQMVDIISAEAAKHSADMAAKRVTFSHTGFETRVANIAKTVGSASAASENIAYGQMTGKEVFNMWLNSAGHKKNMEGNYTLTGIGLAKDNNDIVYFTQIFIRK